MEIRDSEDFSDEDRANIKALLQTFQGRVMGVSYDIRD